MHKETIVVIIPTYNRRDYLRRLLSTLYLQTNTLIDIIIVVIVDGSTDGTIEMLEENYSEVKIVKGDGNWWFTKCINEGFKYGYKLSPDYFLLLNDDVEINATYVESLYKSFKSLNATNAILGSVSRSVTEKQKIIFAGVKTYHKYLGKYKHYFKPGYLVDVKGMYGTHKSVELTARGTLIPVEVVKILDGYDERFVQYGSDTDFCFSAVKQNINVYISFDNYILCHEQLTSDGSRFKNPSFKEFFKSLFSIYSINSLKTSLLFTRKHFGLLDQIIIIPRVLILPLVKFYFDKVKLTD